MLLSIESAPSLNVRVSFTVTLLFKVAPFGLSMVKSFNPMVISGKSRFVPVPPIVRSLVVLPIIVLLPDCSPLSTNLLEPIV